MAFWIMFVWAFAIWYFLQDNMSKKTLCKDGVSDTKVTVLYMVVIFIVPLLLIGLRTWFVDTSTYMREFDNMKADIRLLDDVANKRDHSKLFYGLTFLFKVFISQSSQVWIFTVAVCQSFFVLRTLKKYSVDPGFSVLLFILSGLVGQWMCNGIRQFVAVSILFACSEWIIKKKWYLYILVSILLMGLSPIFSRLGITADIPWVLDGIHQSVIIMIPIFFCINGKVFNWRIWCVAGLLVALIFTGGLEGMLDSSVEGTTYSVDMEYVAADSGTSLPRVIVSSIPFILAFIKRRRLMENDVPPIICISANASAITAILYVASAFTSGIYVGRLPIFTELYSLILLPWLINHAYTKNRQSITVLTFVGYISYFFYQVNITWDGYYHSEILGI